MHSLCCSKVISHLYAELAVVGTDDSALFSITDAESASQQLAQIHGVDGHAPSPGSCNVCQL